MHNITFVNKANFVKLYNNFVLKWLIFALYVVVVLEYRKIITNIDIGGEHLEDTLRICDVMQWVYFVQCMVTCLIGA
jgi:hypothetical protein